MTKQTRVVGASALLVLGGFLVITSLVGGSDLQAASIGSSGLDLSKILIWGGVAAIFLSSLLFISASAK